MNAAPPLPDGLPPVPRRNGEIVFSAPWESRAFGLAVSLEQRGAWSWSEFAARLGDLEVSPEDTAHFYEHWLETLEGLLRDTMLLGSAELETRIGEQTAAEHQHRH